jgi:protein-disulfide isomerase
MRRPSLHLARAWAMLCALGVAAGCYKSDLEDIKDNQKKILKRLASMEKKVRGQKAQPQRKPPPPPDYNKVNKISGQGVAFKGAKNAKVTIVEYTDYQ